MCEIENCLSGKKGPVVSEKDRRLFIKGLLALPLATVLGDPILARAQASRGESIAEQLAGGSDISAYLSRAEQDDAPVVILIHEWWGLNDSIKTMAEELSTKGFHALAIDLFKGSVATDRDGAMAQIRALKTEEAEATLAHWINWAKDNGSGKVATLGWCFGGGWSLKAALSNSYDAAVIYYGNVAVSAAELAGLDMPLLGHFGTLDKSINPQMVGQFQKQLRIAGKDDLLTSHWYTANHAFANPTGGRYDEDDANLAWARTHSFLSAYLL